MDETTKAVIGLLEQTQNASTQQSAETQLKAAETQNFNLYLTSLSKVLALDSLTPTVRSLAGVLIKLSLSGQSEAFQLEKTQRYLEIVDSTRAAIKQNTLSAIVSLSFDVSRAAAQAITSIAVIELPRNLWPDLISTLSQLGTDSNLKSDQKVAPLQALGYICEALDNSHVGNNCIKVEEVNGILNAILSNMSDENVRLYLAATAAVLNALAFASNNFNNVQERNMILKMILSSTKSKDEAVRTKGFECIVKTATLYYEFLGDYMKDIYDCSFNAVKTDAEPVAMQAIEFWTTLAEEELYLLDTEPEKCTNYIKTVGNKLCELILTECLTKQEEGQEEDARNISTAGAMCLGYLSQVMGNDILQLILPYVDSNINSSDWHKREAAVLSFGAMLDGPSIETLRNPLLAAFDTLLSKTLPKYEPNLAVRDTAAWTIAALCNLPQALSILDQQKIEKMLQVLLEVLNDEARVARNSAFAINNFARNVGGEDKETGTVQSNKLSQVFQIFVDRLLRTIDRPDRNEWELAQNAYEAVNSLVENSGKDMAQLVYRLLEESVRRLSLAIDKSPNTTEEKEEKEQLQMFLCGNIQVICMKLGQLDLSVADKIVELMIKLLRIPGASCHSDCFMVLGAVANCVENNFNRYLKHTMELVCIGLNNHQEYQVCQNAVGTLGDICRAVEIEIDPYCDNVMKILHNNLVAGQLNRDVKPPTLAVFGDICLAIGTKFERFLNECMATIFAAAQTVSSSQIDREDEDMIEYVNLLRENILEACTGIIQGMNGDESKNMPSKADKLLPYSETILAFVATIARELADPKTCTVNMSVVKGAVGVMGDLSTVVGKTVRDKIVNAKQYVEPLFRECQRSGDASTQQLAAWSSQVCGLA